MGPLPGKRGGETGLNSLAHDVASPGIHGKAARLKPRSRPSGSVTSRQQSMALIRPSGGPAHFPGCLLPAAIRVLHSACSSPPRPGHDHWLNYFSSWPGPGERRGSGTGEKRNFRTEHRFPADVVSLTVPCGRGHEWTLKGRSRFRPVLSASCGCEGL